ncbi:WD40 repeat domain-containing protein [Streptomyces litmocidini]|uniref:WD40 repeat domain-containing protein n=1 Tax=Streptomyces litmocidini TaxID=67318 RepID=UPI0037034FC9
MTSNPELASLLAVQAYRTSPTRESFESLQSAAALPAHRRPAGHTRAVISVAFSPDGRTLATGSSDWNMMLWDTGAGAARAFLAGHTGDVLSIAFAPGGRTVATASPDKTVALCNVHFPRPADAVKKICGTVNRDLTPEERAMYLPDRSVGPVCPAG